MAANDLTQPLYIDPELSGLARQRQMAQLLVQQGLQQPQADMVGNRYVPVNPMERIGNLASALIGQRGNEVLDVKQNQIADVLRQRGASEVENIFNAMQTGGTKEALAVALKGQTPQAQMLQSELTKQMFREPKWEKSELPDANGNVKIGWVNVNSPNPASTFIIGGTKPDVELAKGRYEGYLPEGGGFGPQSNAGNSAFAPAMAKVFSLEGDAFVAKDGLSGAPAKFGINQKANPDVDVKNLTKPQAEAIYKTRYWDAINGDALPAKTAEIAFDAAVNQGPAYAKQLIAQTNGDPVKMLQQRAQDYTQLVQSDPRQAQYLPSWMNRLQVLSKDVANYSTPSTQNVNTAGLSPKAKMAVEQKTAEAKAEYAQKAPAAMEFMNQTINNINAMIGDTTVDAKGNIVKGKVAPHAGFEAAVGMPTASSGFGISSFMPGSDINDFKARFKQLEGQGFLQAFETLKGAGQITEIEGAKATSALNRMNLAQSEKEFITAAREFESNVKKGMDIAKERAGISSAPAKGGWSVISVTPGR
jgi:lysozyme family protein